MWWRIYFKKYSHTIMGAGKFDSVRQAVTNTIPKKKKCKKAKWLFEEALQIAVKRREAKGKERRKGMPI